MRHACSEMDIVERLEQDLGTELYRPSDPLKTRAVLDSDAGGGKTKMSKLVQALIDGRCRRERLVRLYGVPIFVILACASTMSVGAILAPEPRAYLTALLATGQSIYGLYPRGRRRLGQALETYVDGHPIEMSGKSLGQTAA